MSKVRTLLVLGAVGMLSGAPAFAQTNTAPGSTGPDNSANMPGAAAGNGPADQSATPMNRTGSAQSRPDVASHDRSTQGSAMPSRSHAYRTDSSQNAAVERLNEQSYQAAQRGESFSGSAAPGGTSDSSGMGRTRMQ